MSSLGIRPIVERFLLPNYLMALEFRQGFVFGRVIRRRICQYKPYALVDADGDAIDIHYYDSDHPALSYQSELRFRDPRNPAKDILYLGVTTNSGYPWILHGSIGIKPQYIYMYPRFPEGKDIPGKFPNVDPIMPSAGDLLGYVNELKSPYEEPTDYVEYVISPLQHLGAEYYNWDPSRNHQPVMNLLFAVYWFQALSAGRHPDLISRIANRQVPAAFLTVGFGDFPFELGDTVARDWRVTPLSLDEAAALGGR